MSLPKISSHQLQVIIECGHHGPLVMTLAREVLVARKLHRAIGLWLDDRKPKRGRRTPVLVAAVEEAYKALLETRSV